MKRVVKMALTGLALAGLYELWRRAGRSINSQPPFLNLQAVAEFGQSLGRGNIVGVQPFMFTLDYASERNFLAKLDGYLAAAAAQGWLQAQTVVVLPEYIGTWLVAANEKQAVYHAQTIEQAMQLLVLSHLPRLPGALLSVRASNKLQAGLFHLKAAQMAGIYQRTCARLAQKYGVTLVAGSIVLPDPQVEAGVLQVGRGPLYNVGLVYDPQGLAYPEVVRKIFPIDSERPFVTPAPQIDVPIFETGAGRLGVLICADSWYPSVYEELRAKCAEVVVVPSFLTGHSIWDEPWPGYNGAPPPADVDPSDIWQVTEEAAWLKYALAGRLARTGIRAGLNIFLRGKLWNLGADGHPIVVRNGKVEVINRTPGAALVNVWL